MVDQPTDALLQQVGERVKLNINDEAVRSNLYKLVGEKQQKRIVDKQEESAEATEQPELPTLDPVEQDLAQLQIIELHPLSDTPMHEAFPWLCFCSKFCSKERENKDNKKMREEFDEINKRLNGIIERAEGQKYQGTSFRKDMCEKFGLPFLKKDGTEKAAHKKPTSEEDKTSPFVDYGFGVQSWLKTLWFLFRVYCALSVLAFIIMKQYEGFGGLTPNNKQFGKLTKFSLGNIGFAKSQCFFQYAKIPNTQTLKCKKGILTDLIYYGATSSAKNQLLADGEKRLGHDFCGAKAELQSTSDCTKYFDFDKMVTYYKESCLGKQNCEIDLSSYMKKDVKDAPKDCTSEYTQIYIQTQCSPSSDEFIFAKQTSCMVIFLGLLMALIFSLSVRYLDQIQTFLYKKWDINTATPADFTIQMDISETQYQNYLETLKNGEYAKPLNELIIDSLEAKVSKLDEVVDDAEEKTPIKVATVTFGYKNGELIRTLKQRGALIGAGKFHLVGAKDDLLNQIVKDDEDKLKQPVAAFVTFTQQEAYERCASYLFRFNDQGQPNVYYESFEFLNEVAEIKAAPEPSNVIWENLEVTPFQRGARKTGVVVVVTLFIFFTFIVYSILKSKAGENKLKYPSSTDCDGIESLFKKDGKVNQEQFKSYAEYDKEETFTLRGAGYYMCYCKTQTKFQKIIQQKDYQADMCYLYWEDQAFGFALTNFVTILVTIINIVIRTINIKLINAVGYPTESDQVSLIMRSIFWATFVNTGIILLMTNAELAYAPYPVALFPIHNQYPDFNENWYEEIGPQLTKTMFIMAVYPYLEMIIFGGIWNLKKILDKSCCCFEKHKTKTTTSQMFIDTYAGPAYLMHFKYSSILTQVYISFMYGLFIPVLFPIAAFGILNMYLVEKFALLYYYRKPPMYDATLQKDALQVLRNAPVCMFILGYWAMGNTAIFFNEKATRTNSNDVADPVHHLIDHDHGLNQTHWLMIIVFMLFIKKMIIDSIASCVMWITSYCCQTDWGYEVADVRENIGSFWESLTGDDQKIWYASEIYSKFRFGITTVEDDALEKLRTMDRRKAPKVNDKKPKHIEGDSRYDLLASINYQQDFQYISIEQRNEVEDYMLSDMILRVLNLDEDKKMNNAGEPSRIFQGSYQLLMNQVNYQKEEKKEKHQASQSNEGGESDAFHRFQN